MGKRKTPDRVAAVIERRRSGAAGPHGKPQNRSAARRGAIRDQED
jgi:hypothetical protein